jgi:tetratricopeptide (TPR) repeat protein
VRRKRSEGVVLRAAELVTRLHSDAGRWKLVAQTLGERRKLEPAKVALALAEVDIVANRLGAHERALQILAEARAVSRGDPAIAAATISVLETIGDPKRLRTEMVNLADGASSPLSRVMRLVRAAELAASAGEDDEAVRLYEIARVVMPGEPLVIDRLRRMGARTTTPDDTTTPLLRAVRELDRSGRTPAAEPLLESETRAFCTLRVAERFARRAKSGPQLANALAMQVDLADGKGLLALRALSGLAALVAWTLPESDDVEPWDRLLEAGSRDAVALDTLVARARRGVALREPHAIDLATEATRRRFEASTDDSERLVLAIQIARLARRRERPELAAKACRDALAIDAWSVSAAALLGEAAAEIGDRRGAIMAATAIADVTRDAKARAQLLADAADLSTAEGDVTAAATLLERALESDPEAVTVAARLALLQQQRKAWDDLSRALRRGLAAARTAEAIVPMASELADVARHQLRDPIVAIEALERARAVSPGHVPSLFNLAELYIGQRAWQKSLDALADVISNTNEREEKIVAHLGRASIYGRVLSENEAAERELRAALVLDPHDARAVTAVLKLPSVDKKERAELLGRMVIAESDKNARLTALLELAELRRELGDPTGAEGALVEAAALSPDRSMLERVRVAAGGDAETVARVLGRALARAREANAAPDSAWLVKLGEIEMSLGRTDAAIERFEDVLRVDPGRGSARIALARALSARGRHETAAAALAPLLDGTGQNGATVDVSFVRLLAESFAGAGRVQQLWVARELRAIAGDLDDSERGKLDGRTRAFGTHSEGLPAASLRSFVMPGGLGRHPIWDVAAVCHGMAGKLARIGLTDHGASTRDRIKPRAMHPLRQLFDRLGREFEVFEVELAVSDHLVSPVVAVEDLPWIVAPSSLADWPDSHAIAALAKPFVRVALGVPWAGAIAANEILALLVAVARQVAPGFEARPRDRVEPLVDDYEIRARKAIDRKKRRQLEDLEPQLVSAKPIDESLFADALARTEARAAFLLSGDLRASLDALATSDPALADAIRMPGQKALAAVFARPIARDLVTFALSGESTALRKSLGTLWA